MDQLQNNQLWKRTFVLWGVEVEAERGEVGAQGQVDHARVRLRGPDERQQADHSKLIRYHADGDVGHPAWQTETHELDAPPSSPPLYVSLLTVRKNLDPLLLLVVVVRRRALVSGKLWAV